MMSDTPLQYDEHAERVLKRAQEEAERQDRSYVKIRDLLLGLIREDLGIVSDLFRALGLSLAQVEALVWQSSQGRSPSASQPASRVQSQPLLILDEAGSIALCNKPAQDILDSGETNLLEALKRSIDSSTALTIGNHSYTIVQGHLSDTATLVIMLDFTHAVPYTNKLIEMVHVFFHDINGPIMSIRDIGHFAQEAARESGDEKQERYAERIVRLADLMLESYHTWAASINDLRPGQGSE